MAGFWGKQFPYIPLLLESWTPSQLRRSGFRIPGQAGQASDKRASIDDIATTVLDDHQYTTVPHTYMREGSARQELLEQANSNNLLDNSAT